MSRFTLSRTPAEGTLSPGDTTIYGPRDADHVYPWMEFAPGPGEVWRIDGLFITCVHTTTAYFTISVAPNNIARSATNGGTSVAGALIKYGNSLQPVTHYAWGRAIEPGTSEGVDVGSEILRGDSAPQPPVGGGANQPPIPGRALWLGAFPGTNTNVPPAGENDGTPPGVTIAIHGERLA